MYVVERAAACGKSLANANLTDAYLNRADLSGADLTNADLFRAILFRADLTDADLTDANLTDANLRNANLSNADLTEALLLDADVRGADLSGVTMNWKSHALISERLFQAAGNDIARQMLAAFIGRRTDLCWDGFLAINLRDAQWALDTMRKWVRDGDNAPDVLKKGGV